MPLTLSSGWSSFLTVLNQYGQATSLPGTDPSGLGTSNWELEEALDVEWAYAIAPGAQIILVEANSQSLSDLMASVATAASQPGVSVVSMSWGFPEEQAVFASDEATYDSVFHVPGVTFVASTGDYGAADPEYPAFSPNVVAFGGTSLTLNTDGAYYPGKKDHHKRVTTERPHPTGGSCPREGHGKGKLIRILFSVYFGGFRG